MCVPVNENVCLSVCVRECICFPKQNIMNISLGGALENTNHL